MFQNEKWLTMEESELPATTILAESDNDLEPGFATPSPSLKRKKKLFPEEVFLNEASGFLKNAKIHASSSDPNEDEVFGMLISKGLNEIKSKYRKRRAKLEIYQLLIQHQEEDENE